MKSSTKLIWASGMVFGCLVLSGCTTMKMAVPVKLQTNAARLPVDRPSFFGLNNERCQFGTYVASEINSGWKTTQSLSFMAFGASESQQKFFFNLAEGSQPPKPNYCEVIVNKSSVSGNGWNLQESQHRLSCGLLVNNAKGHQLHLGGQALKNNETVGYLLVGDEHYSIVIVKKAEGGGLETRKPTGFIFLHGQQEVGAIDVCNKGIVYLDNNARPEVKEALASAAVALMVFERMIDSGTD